MSTQNDKFVTDYLTVDQMRRALFSSAAVLHELLGNCRVVANYGVGCKLHIDLWYKPMEVDTSWLWRFIDDTVEHRIVVPGASELRLTAGDRLDLLFCHDSDIHLNGADDELLQRLMATDPFSEFHWQSREQTEGAIDAQRE